MPSEVNKDEGALADVVSGQVWDDFCDALKASGQQILRAEAPSDAFTRAEGWRYLTRLTRIALDMFVECNDADFPAFYRPSHETAKIGADNPDNYYQRAQINGNYEYRIKGTRGTVAYLGFVTLAGGYGEDGKNERTGDLDEIELEADGSFEIVISQHKQGKNWLPISEFSNTVLVRQTFLDRNTETIAELSIERINTHATPAPLDPVQLAHNLKSTSAFVQGTARLFADWSQSYLDKPNQLPPSDQALCQSVGGDPNIFYYHSYFDLADDEALVIDVPEIPPCDNWNLQVDNYWMESLDYRYHKIHVNKHTAHYAQDGSVQLVVSPADIEHPNLLTTAGHNKGTLCFRWIGAKNVIHPTCKVVPAAEIKS